VFFSGPQQYMWYVVVLRKTYNVGDRTFYDAIKDKNKNGESPWLRDCGLQEH
jgi:hypothetical protein